MKVLMTTDAVGGVFTYSLQLASGLAPFGVEVLLASMGRRLSPQQRAQARASRVAIVESEYRLEWMDDPWQDVERAGDWLLDLERQMQPDIVQVNGYAHAALPWRAPALLVAHSSVCSWWRAVLSEPAPARYEPYRRAVASGLRAAKASVAPTASMLRCLVEEYGPIERSRVIHNGMPISPATGRQKEPCVLSAGRVWDRAKNIVQLERAASQLAWPIWVAGDSSGPDGLEAPALPNLRRLGALSHAELAGWMDRAAIFALPARYEPFGLSILEAALASCALVLGDIPSLRELWGGAAVFVDPDDDAALESALVELVSVPSRRALLGKFARRRAERYGAAAMCGRYSALYRSMLLGEQARPRRAAAGQETGELRNLLS